MSRITHVGRTLNEISPELREVQRLSTEAPNVILIVLDDLGFADFGCYGSDIATPRIDEIAQQGLRYNRFHVTAVCSPTRACLLTGRNHHAVGMGILPDMPFGFPGYTGRIPQSAATLPRLLRDAGYSTFAVGKWHLTPRYEQNPSGPFDRWPLGLGFQRFYGFLSGATNQWTPNLVCDNGFIDSPQSPSGGYHLTEDLTNHAIRFIQDQQQNSPDMPFFLYFAPGAMHAPHQVARRWFEPYRGQFDYGWDVMRRQRFLRQVRSGIVPQTTVLTERPPWVLEWEGLSEKERNLYARQMEVYAGFLTHTDAQIGRIIDFLSTIDVMHNTLLIVLSDNGASAEGGPCGQLDTESRDVETMVQRLDDFGGTRSFNHYAWGWAWAGNTPFKLWKRYSWLGGVRVPLIIRWPKTISASASGQVRMQFCHAVDLMPTVLDAARINPPSVLDGVSQKPLAGVSLLDTFSSADCVAAARTQYFETTGSRSIYHDGWKATTDHIDNHIIAERQLMEGSDSFDSDRWALFHVEEDFSESRDLARDFPDRLRQMVELWWHEAGRNEVLPLMDGLLGANYLSAMEPPPHPGRRRYIYLPHGGPIVTPPLDGGFRFVAEVCFPRGLRPSGVLCAQGDRHGGWACYILDARLTMVFVFGERKCELASEAAISNLIGQHKIEVCYHPHAGGDGSAALRLDGRKLSAGLVRGNRHQVWRATSPGQGTLLIGRDNGTPVSDDYEPPFPFSGQIQRVVLELACYASS